MKREISLEELSENNLFDLNDMVKAGCKDCQGCFVCCCGMGESVVLDPLDICRMADCLETGFDGLLSSGAIGLHAEEGIILPHLNMNGTDDRCTFLNEAGRCSIHSSRPGICRMFPLGRYYEGQGFRYFLQLHECPKEPKTKVKVKKWIDTPDIKRYEKYVMAWHEYVHDVQAAAGEAEGEQAKKRISMDLLNVFFRMPYGAEELFYTRFYDRLEEVKKEGGHER